MLTARRLLIWLLLSPIALASVVSVRVSALCVLAFAHACRIWRRLDTTATDNFALLFLGNRVRHGGRHHPVNGHWHEANSVIWPHLAARRRPHLRKIQDDLLLKSNTTPLTKDELAYLKAANNHFDVRTGINFLKGRHRREFGFYGVDQIHGGTMSHPCGCKLALVFDHHKARMGEIDKLHPHTPHATCRHHADHADDLSLLHEYAAEDSGNPDFAELLKQEREAEKLGLPLPPKWVRPVRGA